jgi:hypothetical protein
MFSTVSSISSAITTRPSSLIGTNWIQTASASSLLGATKHFVTEGQKTGSMIEMNYNGKYAIAISQAGSAVVVSSDYGNSWTKVDVTVTIALNTTIQFPSSTNPVGCGISDDGAIMYVSVAQGAIYKSTDFGVTWTKCGGTTATDVYYGLSVSGDGTKILVSRCSSDSNTPNTASDLYLSTNGGDSFSKLGSITGMTEGAWHESYAISKNGNIIVCTPRGVPTSPINKSGIYKSTYDTSKSSWSAWTQIYTGAYEYGRITVCDNGRIVTSAFNTYEGLLIYNGANWITYSPGRVRNSHCSNDGMIIITASCRPSPDNWNGYIQISTDGGVNFKSLDTFLASQYYAFAVAGNGSRVMCSGDATSSRDGLFMSYN